MNATAHELKRILRDYVTFVIPTGLATRPVRTAHIFAEYSETITAPDRIAAHEKAATEGAKIKDIFEQAGLAFVSSKVSKDESLEVVLNRTAWSVTIENTLQGTANPIVDGMRDEVRRAMNTNLYPFMFKAHYAGWKYEGVYMIDEHGEAQPIPVDLAPEDWDMMTHNIFQA